MEDLIFRSAHGPEDAPALIALHAACATKDKTDPLSLVEYLPNREWYENELATTTKEDWVIAEVAGKVVGYGHALWNWQEADGTAVLLHLGWVMPAYRGRGIGGELLARLESRCLAKATAITATQFEFGANAGGTDFDAQALLTTNGYFTGYTVWEMEKDLSRDLTECPPPEGYEIRPVTPDHHLAIWQCIGDAYDVSRPGGRFATIPTESGVQDYFHRDSADPSLWFVAWRGSRVAGQVLCRIGNDRAEVFEVSVGYAHRRKGLAKALLSRALLALRERELKSVRLYTVYENPTEAWRLYEQCGFQKINAFPRWRKTVRT